MPKKRKVRFSRMEHNSQQKWSKYTNLEQTELFALQKKKRESGKRPQFRIITRGKPRYFYELAYGRDLEEFKHNEWSYIKNELHPKLADMSSQTQQKWIIAHITQLALAANQADEEEAELSSDTEAEEDHDPLSDDNPLSDDDYHSKGDRDSKDMTSTSWSTSHGGHGQHVGGSPRQGGKTRQATSMYQGSSPELGEHER